MRKNQGFTMVELLAVIVILGILSVMAILGVSSLINKAHSEQKIQQDKTLKMAAESYIQANKSLAPKSIGESVEISISDLKDARYIKEDILNSKGESCMKESYVRVYKLSKSEYTYTSYLYCGEEERPESTEVPVPTVEIYFTDAKGVRDSSALTNVSEARFGMNITGGKTSSGEALEIDGYNYTISVKKYKENDNSEATSSYEEVYSSGTLSANRLKEMNVEKKIADYIDVTKVSDVRIKVTVRNVVGGEKTILSSSDGTNNTTSFKDIEKPRCLFEGNEGNPLLNSKIVGQAVSDSDWINSSSGGEKTRKITAECDDGDGSQCIRDTFTRTWPNKYQAEAEYGYIQVEDNAGLKNISDDYITSQSICDKPLLSAKDSGYCLVRVNVDITRPTIKVSGYTVKPENISVDSNKNIKLPSGATNVITASNVTANNQNSSITIDSNSYRNLVSKSGTKKWMNKDNYSNGITYVFEVSDNLHLYSWKWETNPANVTYSNNSSYTYSITNDDASGAIKYFTQPQNSACGSRKDVIIVRLYGEGQRGGILTVTDKAGNSSKIQVQANMDRTAPNITNNITGYVWKTASSSARGETYNFGEWKNRNVVVEIANNDANKNEISGFYNYMYTTDRTNDEKVGSSVTISNEGTTKVSFKACDNAGNCSNYSTQKEVRIDKTAPKCNVTATKYDKNDSNLGTYTANTWLKSGEKVKLIATCSDSISGCNTQSFYWESVINQNYNANYGAKGKDAGGEVRDKAGNVTQCGTINVKIDSTPPTCKHTSNATDWTKSDRVVEWWCEDKQSGCETPKSSKNITKTAKTYTIQEHTIKDKAGNETTCEKTDVTVKVDKSAPNFNKFDDGAYCKVIDNKDGTYSVVLNRESVPDDYYYLGEKASRADPHSGFGYRLAIFTTSTSTPSVSTFKSSEGINLGNEGKGTTDACNNKKRFYAYVMLADKLENTSIKKCSGSYKKLCTSSTGSSTGGGSGSSTGGSGSSTDSSADSCSIGNYQACNWVTACRYGITWIYDVNGTSGNDGAVCHGNVSWDYWGWGNGQCDTSTKLYLVNGDISTSERTYVCYDSGQGGSRVIPSIGNGTACGWIENKCINPRTGNPNEYLNQYCSLSTCWG